MVFQDTNINIRLPKKLKDKFVEVSKKQGLNYSMVLRNMIKDYIANESYNSQPQNDGGTSW